ncbi:MAG: Response regulator receiver domain protein [Candidatus Daviesbacteria bacterium GW2011_GWF2_38_6]|uniref:Response regulator receiver domain protein n=1 Tax=Candidatus Daviesbacteria bacterium GW2011_GWF2_38_6 TaxID=1618432 RepID=A0A0G0MSG1_9BACT|nr:MAG: Response regulator receiver domain protein [Candidatus Daviesbacteria bacterium GW2011_GWF2_38_6]
MAQSLLFLHFIMNSAINILVVDDDPVACALLKETLLAENYRVDTAVNGLEALKTIREGSYDLLITDFIMPLLDGLELLTKAKAEQPHLQVILMTASRQEAIFIEAKRQGADAVIPKPLEMNKLLKIIKNILQKQRRK